MNRTALGSIKSIIEQAFDEDRAYPFYLDQRVVEALMSGETVESQKEQLTTVREQGLSSVATNETVFTRVHTDARLNSVLSTAIATLHIVAAELGLLDKERRFVIVRHPRRGGRSATPPIIAHSGLGPLWKEIPSIYLDYRIFEQVHHNESAEDVELVARLVEIEERSVAGGFSYDPEDVNRKRSILERAYDRIAPNRYSFPVVVEAGRRVATMQRLPKAELYELLDRRVEGDDLNFDHDAVMEAIQRLERAAHVAKANDDEAALLDVLELLVAASGHDLHEARNRANVALERVFAPKEYDAPIASSFQTVRAGETCRLSFRLRRRPDGYLLRLYEPDAHSNLTLNSNIITHEVELSANSGGEETAEYFFDTNFPDPGYADYVVLPNGDDKDASPGRLPSGRINVLPNISGQIILQIFPDIHGHTRVYWKAGDGHPGLVYNEHGEVIRLGRFSDIAAHLEDLKKRYRITGIYLLGVQERGTHREDWAEGATSPSPFAPMSLVSIEPSLGGEEEFRTLVERAHELDIRVIVDITPHLNRHSAELSDDLTVRCYDDSGLLVTRSSTDGRYGSWNDGKLLNYRRFEIWQWLSDSIRTLVETFAIDGIRIDTAHAMPIMMKRNNFPYVHDRKRDHEEMVRGEIIVNDREDDHLITTGYYDSACREEIACPLYTFLLRDLTPTLATLTERSFIILAECFWGRERYIARSGVLPYNAALFKICENVTHGRTDVSEIYHLYDTYYANALPPGTEMVGILGNHDERRALNTFGERGVRAAIALTSFLSSLILDYEGSAEGESWKVFMDNIYVNWNQFEAASHRSLEGFYRETYQFHRESNRSGHLLSSDNPLAAGAIKERKDELWIGAFSFSGSTQSIVFHFDKPGLPVVDEQLYRLIDPVYSAVTGEHGYYLGHELKTSDVRTVVPYTDRVKYLILEKRPASELAFFRVFADSFGRIRTISSRNGFKANYAFRVLRDHMSEPAAFVKSVLDKVLPAAGTDSDAAVFSLKRILFHATDDGSIDGKQAWSLIESLRKCDHNRASEIGQRLVDQEAQGPIVFISAEADPFSKSGGLANVVYELPRELAARGEEVYVFTPKYHSGSEQETQRMSRALEKCAVSYSGANVRFFIHGDQYEVGLHTGESDGIHYVLFDHHEFFDGLYWGYTAEDRIRRRVALARASAEAIIHFGINPAFVFTNDAYTGIFTGIVRADAYYSGHEAFRRTAFFHIIHNGGWQYFDSFERYDHGRDLFSALNLPDSEAHMFTDPVNANRINCMAAGIRFADMNVTVSPTYAAQLKVAGDGLERIIGEIAGINNAIAPDFAAKARKVFKQSNIVEKMYPLVIEAINSSDTLCETMERDYPEILESADAPDAISGRKRKDMVIRMRNKLLVQAYYGLEIDPDAILATMLHRVADQKGYQLVLESSEGLIRTLGFQLIVGGPVTWSDDDAKRLAHGLENLGSWYPHQVAVRLGFQDVRIPLLGTDVFLMPSRHEPGGISQLEALACGTPVIARATGGLRDTIKPFARKRSQLSGNGVLFTDYSAGAFYDAAARFAELWRDVGPEGHYMARRNAQKSVYYWDQPAEQYIRLAYGHKEIIRH